MKPFDLEKAKAGAPVCTRAGKPVRIICFDRKGGYPIVALRTLSDGHEHVTTYLKDGRCAGSHIDCDADLFMAVEKKQLWLNLYRSNQWTDKYAEHPYVGFGYYTEEAALARRNETESCIGTLTIEFEE